MTHLTEVQRAEFWEQGYLVVENVFNPTIDFQPLMQEYEGVLDRLTNELYRRGSISSLYADLPFEQRLIAVYRDSDNVYSQHFNASLPPDDVRENTPYWAGSALFHLLRCDRLLDAVESIIGSEIYATPILHVRIKPPEQLTPRNEAGCPKIGKTKIHQDNAGLLPEADGINMLTVWIPMQDAHVKNGCLCVWPRSHQLGLLPHHLDRGLPFIPVEHLKHAGKAVPVPVQSGSVLFMHKCVIHASYANRSDRLRWSFDLRYSPIQQPGVRDFFPGFVARSRLYPETELHDPMVWDRQWQEARKKLAKAGTPPFHRWVEYEANSNTEDA